MNAFERIIVTLAMLGGLIFGGFLVVTLIGNEAPGVAVVVVALVIMGIVWMMSEQEKERSGGE